MLNFVETLVLESCFTLIKAKTEDIGAYVQDSNFSFKQF